MKVALLTLFFLSIAISTVVPHVGPIKSHAPRTYKVSLDDIPEVRWATIIKDY
jgi:hypothetical protein